MSDYVSNIIEAMKNEKSYDNDDSLTVEEVLKLPSFKGYRLLAGAKGLKKRCKHITILETPNGIDWLEGEEFLLTAGYAFTNNEKYKERMLIDAYNRNVSAIAIKEGRYFGDISNKLINQADEFEIPLIEIPYDVVYTNTISSFYNKLFYRKNEYILSLNNIYEKLLSLSFENKDIGEIVKSLSDLSNSNVFLFTSSYKILSSYILDKNNYEKISFLQPFAKEKTFMCDYSKHMINKKVNNSYISVYPIDLDNEIIAYLLVSGDTPIDKSSQSSIEYGLSIISMKLEMDKESQIARNNINKSLVEIMLYKKDLPSSFYQNVESDLNWIPGGFVSGICVGLYPVDNEPYEEYMDYVYYYLNDSSEGKNYLLHSTSNNLYIFYRYDSDESLEDFVSALYNYLKDYKDRLSVSIGVSNHYDNLEKIESIRDESFLASLFTKKGIIYYNSLDTIKLLYPLKDDREMQEYYKNTIEKIEEYDEINESNLVKTLEIFFRYNLKRNVTSEKLFIHVETLRYRLKKIEEITGYSLDDSEGLFSLQMGIKLRSLLKLK